MLSGRLPFDGAPAAVLVAHVSRPAPPLRDFAPDVSEPLAAVIARCLEKDPAARYATGAALAQALEDALLAPGGLHAGAAAVAPSLRDRAPRDKRPQRFLRRNRAKFRHMRHAFPLTRPRMYGAARRRCRSPKPGVSRRSTHSPRRPTWTRLAAIPSCTYRKLRWRPASLASSWRSRSRRLRPTQPRRSGDHVATARRG